MPRFSANVSTLFREFPMQERIAQAAAAGFDAIEIQFPYDRDPETLNSELAAAKLPLVLMNFPAGDLMDGGQGLAAVPGREAEFQQSLDEARAYAEILRPRAMNLLAGRPGPRHEHAQCEAVFMANLRKAYTLTRDLGIILLTEPVNTIDSPGFFLCGSQQALDLADALPDIELLMQYDLYHMHMMESDLPIRLPDVIQRIGHIQFSDAPGRTEPRPGGIDFARIFSLVDALGYTGYVGAEYFPAGPTLATLGWLEPYRQQPGNR
ncbi:MAG: TIM barrel protein [Gammaproteobacteria bacterium]|nr:TIM barrel protein [Gammaproteobacteria bacterium]